MLTDPKQRIAWILLILGAALSSILLYKANHVPQQHQRSIDHYQDAFMLNAQIKQTDAQGKLIMTLLSPRLDHYPNEIINFQSPQITITTNSGSPWVINADEGQTRNQTKIVHFWGNVHISRAASATNKAMMITTPALDYNAQTKTAFSPQTVLVNEWPDNKMQATGFKAYLDKNQVELLSNVSGFYVQISH